MKNEALKNMHGYYCKSNGTEKAFKFMNRKARKKRDGEYNIAETSNGDLVIKSSDYEGPDKIIGTAISDTVKVGDIINDVIECDEYYERLRGKISKMTDDEFKDYVSPCFANYKLIKIRVHNKHFRGIISAPTNSYTVMAGGAMTYFVTFTNDDTPSRIFNFVDKIKLVNEIGYSKFTSWDSIDFGMSDFLSIDESTVIK